MAKFNYKLDETLFPEVWLTWLSSKGRLWMNKGGVRQNYPEWWMDYTEYNMKYHRSNNGKTPYGCGWRNRNCDRVWVEAGSQIYYAYAKYHKDIDRLELAVVQYDTSRGDHMHHWDYAGDRIFIGKDKSVLNEWGMEFSNNTRYVVRRGWSVQSPREMIQVILRSTVNPKVLAEFKKFIGNDYFILGNGASEQIEDAYSIQKWYDSKQKTRTNGKTQKFVDELTKMPLGSIECLSDEFSPRLRDGYYRSDDYIRNIVYFERVNDKWSVLRGLIRENGGDFTEAWRMYLGDDGTSRFASNSNGEWIPSSQQKGWHFNNQYYFANPNEAIEKCNRIKYISPMINEDLNISAIITTLRFSTIEQLYKMGYTRMALSIANSGTPKARLKELFGGYYNDKEKNVLRQIGLTKHQLDVMHDKRDNSSYYSYYNCSEALKRMREALGKDLSSIDNATYDNYFNTFVEMCENFWGMRRIDELDIDKSKFWKNLVRLYSKDRQSARLVGDTLNTYHRLDAPRPEVDWIFDDYSDIVRVHDALTELVNEQERRYRAYWNVSEAERLKRDEEKRKKTDEERKHYEYEDDEFIIRLPKDVNEIVSEGTTQHICIGGYTTRHSRGETNLFFLRRKDAESVPFYAIEMNNAKQIVQIHGFGNKWLGNNPEAIPTVIRWLRKNNIKCDNKILTCTARGYGRTNNYIEMPIVD